MTVVRQLAALEYLPRSRLGQQLLKPTTKEVFIHSVNHNHLVISCVSFSLAFLYDSSVLHFFGCACVGVCMIN